MALSLQAADAEFVGGFAHAVVHAVGIHVELFGDLHEQVALANQAEHGLLLGA